jgi:hypothetical protein
MDKDGNSNGGTVQPSADASTGPVAEFGALRQEILDHNGRMQGVFSLQGSQ